MWSDWSQTSSVNDAADQSTLKLTFDLTAIERWAAYIQTTRLGNVRKNAVASDNGFFYTLTGEATQVDSESTSLATAADTTGSEVAATSTLTVDTQANLANNDYFILHEASNNPAAATAVCFWFDTDAGLTDDTSTAAECQAANGIAGGVEVAIDGDTTAANVAATLDTAIDGTGAALDVTSTDNSDGTLTLTQDTVGSVGNISLNSAYLAEAASGAAALTAFTGGTDTSYLVREGQSETFTLTAVVDPDIPTPDAAGFYGLQLSEYWITTNSDGTTSTAEVDVTSENIETDKEHIGS
ncbi:MAG: hypothetical protein U5L75_02550 [Candidatus Campbellbacteria bacterium]|nr:hypothetical protein [Candidatus Campbellbacteria bacterium]